MAEFSEVMRQWKRMCGGMYGCEKCPLRQADIEGTYVCDSGITCFDYKGAEPIIMAWAAEYPEPVYPTWKEWLEEQRVVVHFDSVSEKGTKVKWELTNKSNCRIPADIAQKLGIEPKEAEP